MKNNFRTAKQNNAELTGDVELGSERLKIDFSEIKTVFDDLVKKQKSQQPSSAVSDSRLHFIYQAQSPVLRLQTFKPLIFEDYRGQYLESWNSKDYEKWISRYHESETSKLEWKQDDFSYSHKNVLRGLHGDFKTWKLVQCIKGRILLCVFNCNKKSETFKQHEFFTITENNHQQVLIPPGYANGHLALVNDVVFHYKQSEFYDQKSQFIVKWNSSGMKWPIKDPILSKRDEQGPFLNLLK